MIIDKIDNYSLYANLTERLAKGFEFIKNTDLVQIEPGTYEIDNKEVFAIVQEYDTKEIKDCVLEGHTKYIDIQYVIEGAELMGVTTKKNQKVVTSDLDKDYTFYEGETAYIRLKAGMFTVFFPDDLHRPCVQNGQSSRVKKVVVKVQI
ncbi:YhcH/YjgK/YiaL family protein [Flavobacterium degerlachei]|jgi:YhcH/YjgK/YiaL family protein|uniref:YhcH/YjgK/YiaL family protein n=1 Tax=Flavobacterium degerlachei TaxID=229203 RepID=A0A1H2UDJ1_9FLAO|nr:YhcH/YjgK/YiaL family protein [Flavobacterium degerlachei]SDW53534.1 YhcH/YjgK/YiaL family protein [Flavobacterium degerlachei]